MKKNDAAFGTFDPAKASACLAAASAAAKASDFCDALPPVVECKNVFYGTKGPGEDGERGVDDAHRLPRRLLLQARRIEEGERPCAPGGRRRGLRPARGPLLVGMHAGQRLRLRDEVVFQSRARRHEVLG